MQSKIFKTKLGKKPVSDSSNTETDNSSSNNSKTNDFGNLSELYLRETGNY